MGSKLKSIRDKCVRSVRELAPQITITNFSLLMSHLMSQRSAGATRTGSNRKDEKKVSQLHLKVSFDSAVKWRDSVVFGAELEV